MKNVIKVTLFIACLLFSLPLSAQEIRELSWNDLIPSNLIAEEPTTHLPQKQKDFINWIIFLNENMPENPSEKTKKYLQELQDGIKQLREQGIDIEKLIELRKNLRTSVVGSLNKKQIRIPGYLLPLELSGTKATEFLLVPYIGACIHAPPPPPNQIIHVKTSSKEGYRSDKLFEPVSVTGELSVQSLVKDLYLKDGSADINIGYSMKAIKLEPYQN